MTSPKLLRLGRSTHELPKFGRAITSLPAELVLRVVHSHVAGVSKNKSSNEKFTELMALWMSESSTHGEITVELLDLLTDWPSTARGMFQLSKLCGALGLFEAALSAEEKALARLAQSKFLSASTPGRLISLGAAIHLGDKARGHELRERIKASVSRADSAAFSVLDLLNYAANWLDGQNCEFSASRIASLLPRDWVEYILGRSVLLIGPGQTSQTPPNLPEIIARFPGPGAFFPQPAGDLAMGHTDIVYLIRESLEQESKVNPELIEYLQKIAFVCIKRWSSTTLTNSRPVDGMSRLFLHGHPNVVPLAVIDILRIDGARVSVTGVDFFSSGTSYRADTIRITPEGSPQTKQGSTGNSYDRSTLMASHNAFQNRRLVKNLLDSGRVTGDDAFLEACSLSDLDYAKRLDLHYGQHRL